MTKNNRKILILVLSIIVLSTTLLWGQINSSPDKTSDSTLKEVQKKDQLNLATNDIWTGEPFSYFRDLKVVKSKKYLISTAHHLSSQVGKEILSKGGNAVDSAIAAQLVLNVVEPQSSGIGGGAFILFYDAKTKSTTSYNGRETAPENAHGEMFLKNNGLPRKFQDVVRGGLSVGTPGLLKAMKKIHDAHGKLPWEKLFQRAIQLASFGFPMDARIRSLAGKVSYLKDFEEFAKIYLKEDGTPKDLGTIITNPKLAKTFTILAKEGIEPFYTGEIAKELVNTVKNSKINPGYLNLNDLANYKTKEGDLICGQYRGQYKICSMSLPSSGGVTILQILGILNNFNLSILKPSSAEASHLIIEATRLGYADRNQYIADIANVPIKQMLDTNYLKSRASLISKNKVINKVTAGIFNNIKNDKIIDKNAPELPSTTHISVVDTEGNAVSMTSSIEYYFGSVLTSGGFILNNQLTDFSFTPQIGGKSVANSVEPGKQPRSSMSPTFIFDENDNLIMVVGSPGGPRIIQYVTKAIIAYLDWGLNIQEAISLPNLIVLNGTVELEKGTSIEKLKPALEKLGHRVKLNDLVSGINGIVINPNKSGLEGGSDPRRAGAAMGDLIIN